MRHFKKTLLAGAIAATASAPALAELSANIGVTSDYLFRGVTQTQGEAAVQGGIDWAHESGFYLGTWASNVDFGGTATVEGTEVLTPDSADYEIDFYGGYAGSFGDFGYDVGLIYYAYPDADTDIDLTELYIGGSYMWFSAGLAYVIDSDNDGPTDSLAEDDLYYYLSAAFDVMEDWSVAGTLGWWTFDNDGAFDAEEGRKLDFDYMHYQIDVTKSAGEFGDFTLTFSKNDDDNDFTGGDDLEVAVSWGKSF